MTMPSDVTAWGPRRRIPPPINPAKQDPTQEDIKKSLDTLVRLQTLKAGFSSYLFTVTTTPQRMYVAPQNRAISILNPSRSAGLTTNGTVLALAARNGTGNTTATPLGVGNYRTIALFLDITVNAGPSTLTIDALTKDSLSGNWADASTDIFGSANAVGTYVKQLGTLGVDSNFALRWTDSGAITFSISYVLKDGLVGSSAGVDQTIYIGGTSGINTSSGYPILEGANEKYYVEQNTEIYAVAGASVPIRIFELS